MNLELVLFYAFAGLSIFSAVAMVAFVRHVVAGAMSLVVTMISLAGIYVLLHAELVAAIQIMVYAGAILVLFLFVIMLLNLRDGGFPAAPGGQRVLKLVGVAGAMGVGLLLFAELWRIVDFPVAPATLPPDFGTYRDVGLALYGDYVLAVELVALLLLAGIVGAVILAKRRID